MLFVSPPHSVPPKEFKTPLQEAVYTVLEELGISFERVDTDVVITMEDCARINEVLDMQMVKTLFLCDRKRTNFYLFVTRGDKPFDSKAFSQALGISRVSFAPAEAMKEILGTEIGAATVFSVLLDSARDVRMVIDADVLDDAWYGCSDGTTTGYMKIRTTDITEKLLPYVRRQPRIAAV